ncbi:MAG: fasciclin domain-containing protein [Patescibacteria group bacterium]
MSKNIVETAIDAGSFTTLVSAVQAADLVETLSGEGPFTVFAPTDEAFAKLPSGTLESLLENKEGLAKILTYHVVAGKVMSADVAALSEATTVQGGTLTFDTNNGVKVNNAMVTQADIETNNGVIHVIDTVLIPEEN